MANERYQARIQIGKEKRSIVGSIAQCANWADNMIRIYGTCNVDIKRMDSEDVEGGIPNENH